MLSKRYVLLFALVLALTSFPGCIPAPPGMSIRAYQWHRVGSLETRIPIHQSPVTGDWQSDIGYNADAPNEITHFRVILDRVTGVANVANTRSPARWAFILGAICVDNRFIEDSDAGPGEVAQIVLPCQRINPPPHLTFDPGSVDAQATPGSFLISAEGIVDTSYGMPQIDFFDQYGRLASTITVSSLTVDDQGVTWMAGSMPILTYNGSYYVMVNQLQEDDSLEVLGTSTIIVSNGQDPPVYDPPPDEDPCGPDLCVY